MTDFLLQYLDYIVLFSYLFVVVGWGCWFAWRNDTSEQFMSAGRGLPGWVVGLSIFGSYVSSISFLANPGKAYKDNWNPLIFAFSLPFAAWIATRWYVPFFRSSGEVSAYNHMEHRFGPWARTFCVICYLLTQLGRLGAILYLLSLALQPLLGFSNSADPTYYLVMTILVSGFVVTVYPFFGGSEGVIWTGAVQAIVLVLGVVVCVITVCVEMPLGPGQILTLGQASNKFSLGSWDMSVFTPDPKAMPTILVVFLYGIFTNLQNFGINQEYVQRYISARSDRDAGNSVWMGALAYIPLNIMFLFIGTALFAYYQVHSADLPMKDGIVKTDGVFPYFIAHGLLPGLKGLVIAAICSAAMDSNLNCCATLYLCDIHRRYVRPQASERESMWVLRLTILVMGVLSTLAAIAVKDVTSALDMWWKLSGILGGGILGLFLLGILSRRANSKAAAIATTLGVAVIIWMTFSPTATWLPDQFRSHFHDFMTIVNGTTVIVVTGFVLSLFPAFRTAGVAHHLPVSAEAIVPSGPEAITP